MSKIKGYTLSEVLVVLVLYVIVSSMGYLGLDMIMRQFYVTKRLNTETIALHTSFARIKKDFFGAQSVLVKSDGFELVDIKRQLSYRFKDEFLIRKDEKVDIEDTLLTNVQNYGLYWNGNKQFIPKAEIDSLVIQVVISGQEKELVVVKEKYAKDKLKLIGH